MSHPVIRAEHLGKRYRIGHRLRPGTARDAIAGMTSRLVKALRFGGAETAPDEDTLWALDDVSFEVNAGEVVGIIGRNGAGKSTLLKVLSQITEPSTGFVDVTGRIGSLLEVGTGFHEDLTGRENTFLNGAILGMSRAEINRKFDEIVAFAEIDRFIDTPVKHYSSGMYMRLAFAVAAHLGTEILVVDEVLAVGDAQFQKKCLGKMDDIARHGRTVLFISHNMEAIQRLCTRGLLMDRGRLLMSGSVTDAVSEYRSRERTAIDIGRFNPRSRDGTGWALITDLALVGDAGGRLSGVPAECDLIFEMKVEMQRRASTSASLRGLTVHLVVASDAGQPLISLMNVDDGGVAIPSTQACCLRIRVKAPTFIPGRYRINAFIGIPFSEHVDHVVDALEFDILPPERPWRPYELTADSGQTCRLGQWTCVGVGPDNARD
jgi:lipopolysaccharide transport system ATP-binding protein